MKRTAKILLSTMLVLMFVFSFAGAVPAAWADYKDEGVLEAAFYLWQDETGSEEEGSYISYTDDNASADFGKLDDTDDSFLLSLKTNGVTVTIPQDLYVESVTLSAKDEKTPEKILNLNEYAVLVNEKLDEEPFSRQKLVIDASAFADAEDGSNILDVLGNSDAYIFSVYFRSIDEDAEVKITCTDGALNSQLFDDAESVVDEKGYEVQALTDELKQTAIKTYCKDFTGWKLIYPSGISMDVQPGDTLQPYMSCELAAQWKDVIVVQVKDASKTYDSQPLNAECTVNGVDILETGEKLVVVLDEENKSITNVGDVSCSASASVNGAEEGKYTIYTYPGTLKVTPAPITIQSGSGEKVYDGEPMTNVTLKISGKTYGEDSLKAEATGTITDVGQVTNTISYALNRNEKNYDIKVVEGTLKVTARSLTLTTNDATADYTGAALTTKDGYTVDGLVPGHKKTVTITGSQTVPGTSDNTADIVIKDADNQDVTKNYNITKELGKLTVNTLSGDKRIAVTLAPKAATAEYDGTAHGASDYEIVSGKLPEGVSLEVTYGGGRTDAGEGETSIASYKLTQNDTDVTANFNVTTNTGKITISQRPITVTADSATKEYDTKPLTQNTVKITEGSLVSGHKVTAIVEGSQTEVGTGKNTIKKDSVVISDASDKDVTANYAITLKEGKLEVTGKAITDITVTAGATKVYDGKALTLSASDIKVTPALPSGYTISATFSVSSRTDAGKDDVTLTNIVIKDASGENVTSKFNIKVEKGSLEVTKRPLTITTGDKTKVYDGKALTDRDVPTREGQLKAHNIKLEFTGSQTKVGSSDNSVKVLSIYDKETNADVTKNYEITYKFGKLTVTSATGNSTDNTKPTVQTGDTNNIWIWIVLMVVAATAAAVAIVIIVRKNKKNGGDPTDPKNNDQTK